MARKASSKPESGSSSTATIGFEADSCGFDIRHSGFVISSARSLAIRGIEADNGKEEADTFRRDLHPDLRADYVLANPPFNDSDTALRGSAFLQSEAKTPVVSEAKDNFRKDDNVRWQPSGARSTANGSPQGERWGVYQFGVPPKGNANFAWVQHFIHHLAAHKRANPQPT